MLNATKWAHLIWQPRYIDAENESRACAHKERTYFVEVQRYLDFKYGASRVDIALPDGSVAELVVSADGRVYFQIPIND